MTWLDTDEHRRKRTLAVALVGLLAVALFSVNLITIGQQTVLSESHVVESFDDENVYADVTVALREDFTEGLSTTNETAALAETGFPTNYTRGEIDRNIRDVYAFLDGERATADVSLNYTTVRQRLRSADTTAETQQAINETLPERIIIEESLDEGSLSLLRPVVGNIQRLFLVSAVLVLVSVGVVIYRSRSYQQTAKRTGVAVSVAAVLSLLTGAVLFVLLSVTSAPPPAEGEIDPELVFAGIFGALESAIVSLLLQSLGLLALGLALAWIGRGEPVRPPVPSDVEGDGEEAGGSDVDIEEINGTNSAEADDSEGDVEDTNGTDSEEKVDGSETDQSEADR